MRVLKNVLIVVLAVAMLGLSGTMAWATVNEFDQRSTVPCGVSVEGTDLSGMTEQEAARAIASAVGDPLTRPVTVTTPLDTETYSPEEDVTVDVEAMLADAYDPRAEATFGERLACSFGQPILHEVEPVYAVDTEAIESWVAGVAGEVDLAARNASVDLVNGEVSWTEAKTGRKVDRKEAAALIAAAVTSDDRDIELPVATLEPEVTMEDLPRVIVVDQSQRRLHLYDKGSELSTWPVAVGTPGHPTPLGEFEITLKRYMPTWVNPGSAWAASMPDRIAPGYSNPLGIRALNLNASGIRIHGTTNIGSLGSAASHGCIRMANPSVAALYDEVEVGTPVYIVP